MGVEWFGMVMGLGFVLSFGYWCTDFLVVQRAMAADSMSAARRTPLIAAIPKMLFPVLVIVPGMIALVAGSRWPSASRRSPGERRPAPTAATRLAPAATPACAANRPWRWPRQGVDPAKLDSQGQPKTDQKGVVVLDYDLATPMMLIHYFPTGLLGLGLTALMASFMSGMAGNVTAFNTVWTYDIYQSYINRRARPTITISGWAAWPRSSASRCQIAAAYVATQFNNIMDLLQLVFGFVNAPLFATFLLGMFWRRATGHGGFLRPAVGHACGGGPPRLEPARRRGSGTQGRLPRQTHGRQRHEPDPRLLPLRQAAAPVSAATWARTSGRRSGPSPSASW